MEKKLIDKEIFHKYLQIPPRWLDIKHIEFQDEDLIQCGYVEPYYGSDSSHDGYYNISIVRKVLETDEQLEKRLKSAKITNKLLKDRRRENYLKLKKEFENEEI